MRLGSTPARTTSSLDSLVQNSVRIGKRSLPFPSQEEYARYLDFIFEDINACHPCLNENDFRSKCGALLTTRTMEPRDACLLATNYILFACADILTHVGPIEKNKPLPGWQWYAAADELMGKRKTSGRADLSLIQFLVYEVWNSFLLFTILNFLTPHRPSTSSISTMRTQHIASQG